MRNIDLDEFIRNVREYQTSVYALEYSYQKMLKRNDIWERLDQIDYGKTKTILKFLNKWKCRLGGDCVPSLTQALRECSNPISKMNNLSLDQVRYEDLIANSEIVEEVFRKISSVRVNGGRRTVSATATSKILHLTNPKFFMMSDARIRRDWGWLNNQVGYAKFMQRMKLFGDDIMHQYSAKRNVPLDVTFTNLAIECKSKATTLPKLLDEYNWTKSNYG